MERNYPQLTYEQKRRFIGEEYIANIGRSFPTEHLGVADKFLLTKVVLDILEECDRDHLPIRHYRTIVAVCTDAERKYGYKCDPKYKETV